MDPTCLVSRVQAGGDDVNSVGNVFLTHLEPLNTNQSSFGRHNLSELLFEA